MIVLFDILFILVVVALAILSFIFLPLSTILGYGVWIVLLIILFYLAKHLFTFRRINSVQKGIPIAIAGFFSDILKVIPILVLMIALIQLYQTNTDTIERYLLIGLGSIGMLLVSGAIGLCNSIAFRAFEYDEYSEHEVSTAKYITVNIISFLLPAIIFCIILSIAMNFLLKDVITEVFSIYF